MSASLLLLLLLSSLSYSKILVLSVVFVASITVLFFVIYLSQGYIENKFSIFTKIKIKLHTLFFLLIKSHWNILLLIDWVFSFQALIKWVISSHRPLWIRIPKNKNFSNSTFKRRRINKLGTDKSQLPYVRNTHFEVLMHPLSPVIISTEKGNASRLKWILCHSLCHQSKFGFSVNILEFMHAMYLLNL